MTESRTSAVAEGEEEELSEPRVPVRRTPSKKSMSQVRQESHSGQVRKTNL